MKKKMLVLLTIMMAIGLLGACANSGGGNANASTAAVEKTTQAITENTTDAVTEAASESQGDGIVHFYIVRHGKTMLNTTDRVQGWSDAVLTPEGEEVVAQAGNGMAKSGLTFAAAYSSDSGRSIQTANIILEKTGQKDLALKTDWRLREFNFGTYEGELNETMWTDIAALQGKTLKDWMAEGIDSKVFADSVAELDKGRDETGLNWPAEDYLTITVRLTESFDDIANEMSKQGGGNVLIVSHGLSITALINAIAPDVETPAGGFKNASVTTVDYKDGVYTVQEVGDVSYIEAGK